MNGLWERYRAFFDERILRERIIIALCVLASIYLLWDFLLLQNLAAERGQLDLRHKAAKSEITKIDTEQRVLSQALVSGPNAKKQREITQLNERLASLDKEIVALSVGLVSAETLPDVLREVLANRRDLSLLGLHALEPEKLSLINVDENALSEDATSDVGVYKHRVILRMKGRYFAIRDYLAELESSKWHFYWSNLEYVVDGYPDAVAQLEVYTLSTDRGFIGE